MKATLLESYKSLDTLYNTHKDYSYEYLVNFSNTKDLPVHRWYYYVEGFSPKLVTNIYSYLGLSAKSSIIFDPFSGSGTSLMAAKELGVDSTGFEINPFSSFMSKVKTRNYSVNQINEFYDFQVPTYRPLSNVYDKYELRIIANLFDKVKLEKIEILKEEVNKIKDDKVRDLLYFAILSSLPSISNYRKGGNGLKKKRVFTDLDPFIIFNEIKAKMYADLVFSSYNDHEPIVINDSCLNIGNYNIPQISFSIFSPPYANCFDPFEVYKIELWVGEFVTDYQDLRNKRRLALSSNLNANIDFHDISLFHSGTLENILSYLYEQPLWDKKIPKMLKSYFNQMYLLLSRLYEKTNSGGFCVIVVGNSAYGQIAVPTDLLLSEVGQLVGFQVCEIIEARKNETSSQQHLKLGDHLEFIRESIIILQK